MKKICVIGSLNMDYVINTPKIPVMGETLHGSGFMTSPGGKGANQAVAAARLGAQVTMVGRVGDDMQGRELVKNLNDNNVNTENIKIIRDISTGAAVITLKDGDNYIILDSGANGRLTCEDIDDIEDIIISNDILILQLEIPLKVVQRVIEIANKNGTRVLLNPAPAYDLSDYLLSMVDILTPNQSECESITGISAKSVEGAKEGLKSLLSKGIKQVVITMGSKGVVYNSGNEIIHKPVLDVKVVDTTAAGDCFSAALATSISDGNSIDEAVDFANSAATLTVTKKGAQSSLPFLQDI